MSRLGEQTGAFEPQTLRVTVNLLCALALVLVCSAIRSPSIRPDMATLVVVFFALEHELVIGLFLAAGAGYLSDVFSGLGPGLDAATCVGVYLVLRVFVARIVGSRLFMVTVLSLLSTVLALVIRQLIEATLGPNQASLRALIPALPSILGGAVLLGFPVYRILCAVDVYFRPREQVGLGGRTSRSLNP